MVSSHLFHIAAAEAGYKGKEAFKIAEIACFSALNEEINSQWFRDGARFVAEREKRHELARNVEHCPDE